MTGVEEKLDWIQLKKDINSEEVILAEGGIQKLIRKTKENPLVPLGALVTVGFLTNGLRMFKQGNSRMSQMMMRGRVLAQGFTLIALISGILLAKKG